ncbi:MAG: SIR2 family protein [Planctomycetota bacterium]
MSQFEAMNRLVDRILGGEAVFFIGSGFSVDSEHNTASRLMLRLLVRFEAMTSVLVRATRTLVFHDELRQLSDRLNQTFRLRDEGNERDLRDEAWRLSVRYYEANDWFCGTYLRLLLAMAEVCEIRGELSGDLSEQQASLAELITEIWDAENQRLLSIRVPSKKNVPATPSDPQADPVPFDPIDPRLIFWAVHASQDHSLPHGQHPGKALFLDTMGFANPEIMRGGWTLRRDVTLTHYQSRLFPRHHVLARLAREGLCPLVMTTNYDLLLEGAYRLSGFEAENAQRDPLLRTDRMPRLRSAQMARIGKATEFFRYERANRSANVVKVHGCAEIYRQQRLSRTEQIDVHAWLQGEIEIDSPGQVAPETWERWAAYLPSMVFTYREIQHWRGESWAKDYLATVQRTRNVVFAGYSLQDPVIHDSFRRVYEEMRSVRVRLDGNGRSQPEVSEENPAQGPAWFWAQNQEHSFHANEVLGAASAAVAGGLRVETANHPNTLHFQFLGKGFPTYDDAFLWLFHCVFRHNQFEALKANLIPLANSILGKPMLRSEYRETLDRFQQLMTSESKLAEELLQSGQATDASTLQEARSHTARQRSWLDMIHWTYSFASGLLKEIVAIEMLQRESGPSVELAQMRKQHWYYPASANPVASAWTAIVELAIRNMVQEQHKRSDKIDEAGPRLCWPANDHRPTVFVTIPRDGLQQPEICRIRVQAGEDDRVAPAKQTSAHREYVWRLSANQFPWPTVEPKRKAKKKRPSSASTRLAEEWDIPSRSASTLLMAARGQAVEPLATTPTQTSRGKKP